MKKHAAHRLVAVAVLAVAIASYAQTFTTLDTFDGANGSDPYYGSLVQALDGNLYGTTQAGGLSNKGTIFRLTPGGTLTTLYSFCSLASCADGALPWAGMTLGPDGDLYGTTNEGGISTNGCPRTGGCGTVFRFDPRGSGSLTTLHQFCTGGNTCSDGALPTGRLFLSRTVAKAPHGGTVTTFYGSTSSGGVDYNGTAFSMVGGTVTTLYDFCAQPSCTDGAEPLAGLIQGSDGYLYGTAAFGGASNNGTLFRIVPSQTGGVLTVLHTFNSTDGSQPSASLVQGTDGNLYGTTAVGGVPNNSGTVFKITRKGVFTSLHTFCPDSPCLDGAEPYGALIEANDGNFYGTASLGGSTTCSSGCGTIFEVTSKGAFNLLYTFDSTVGADPLGGLVQATNGTLYGTTYGMTGIPGIVFSLSGNLKPLITTVPAAGRVGAPVTILGTGLTGATSVTFNSTAATFTVVSDSEITTTVPTAATTGKVAVVTPGGTLSTDVAFQVVPVIKSFSPSSGPVGTVVTLAGSSFTGATSVTFGGVKASFTVNSNTQITATVPTEAVTGKVSVTTPGGKAISGSAFTVN